MRLHTNRTECGENAKTNALTRSDEIEENRLIDRFARDAFYTFSRFLMGSRNAHAHYYTLLHYTIRAAAAVRRTAEEIGDGMNVRLLQIHRAVTVSIYRIGGSFFGLICTWVVVVTDKRLTCSCETFDVYTYTHTRIYTYIYTRVYGRVQITRRLYVSFL